MHIQHKQICRMTNIGVWF